MSKIPDNFFVLEIANNHMGSVDHAIAIVDSYAQICKKYPFNFAMKLQYRNLDTFIHPDLIHRTDLKYIKRFQETRLSKEDFFKIVKHIKEQGFYTVVTPFDESSVDLIVQHGVDILKIASCSFTDWPLLEKVVTTNLPIIASTAGTSFAEMDRVVSFLKNRHRDFTLLHCVGEYPTKNEDMHLSQIPLMQERYPGTRIGFSSHEAPDQLDLVKIAIAKGATIFEKHVGLPLENSPLNAYSMNPNQTDFWLGAALAARTMCGVGDQRRPTNLAEQASLNSLKRGLFAKRDIEVNEALNTTNTYLAFPPEESQLKASDCSKYIQIIATQKIFFNQPVFHSKVQIFDARDELQSIVNRIKDFLKQGNIVVPNGVDLEISHHYGLNQFDQFGMAMITVVNREYCKKLLILLPHQAHPEQYHENKEETFHLLHGELEIVLNGQAQTIHPGTVITIDPGMRHAFKTITGAVIEEISSTHFKNDSFYTDPNIMNNANRKTFLSYWN